MTLPLDSPDSVQTKTPKPIALYQIKAPNPYEGTIINSKRSHHKGTFESPHRREERFKPLECGFQ